MVDCLSKDNCVLRLRHPAVTLLGWQQGLGLGTFIGKSPQSLASVAAQVPHVVASLSPSHPHRTLQEGDGRSTPPCSSVGGDHTFLYRGTGKN